MMMIRISQPFQTAPVSQSVSQSVYGLAWMYCPMATTAAKISSPVGTICSGGSRNPNSLAHDTHDITQASQSVDQSESQLASQSISQSLSQPLSQSVS